MTMSRHGHCQAHQPHQRVRLADAEVVAREHAQRAPAVEQIPQVLEDAIEAALEHERVVLAAPGLGR